MVADDHAMTPEAMRAALDAIHDIAAKAALHEGDPEVVSRAFDDIVALARYKFDVTPGIDRQYWNELEA